MTKQMDNLLTRDRSIVVPAKTRGPEAGAAGVGDPGGDVTTSHWLLLYMLALGLFGAIVVVLGAEVW
jgi:hypothetical protein